MNPIIASLIKYSSNNDVRNLRQYLSPIIIPAIRQRKWLLNTNRYYENVIKQLEIDYNASPQNVNNNEISNYVLCSSPIHCLDGWSFLGRAIDALGRADIASVVHFAYYAELRAALSLLAADGIGILNNLHVICRLSGGSITVDMWKGPTHKEAWEALEAWSTSPNCSDLFLQDIKPNNVPLKQWITAYGLSVGATGRKTVQDLLQQWGLDLRLSSSSSTSFIGQPVLDRNARNEMSYRPTRLTAWPRCHLEKNYEVIQDLWLFLQPGFQLVDRELLHSTLIAFRKRGYQQRLSNMISFVVDGIRPLGLGTHTLSPSARHWLDLLNNPSRHKIVDYARGCDIVRSAQQHLQILCRAALLLRMATANCQRLLTDVGISSSQLHFWWHPLVREMGIVSIGSIPGIAGDLWLDVEMQLNDVNTWMRGHSSSISPIDWRTNNAVPLSVLGEFERVGLWGLNL